MFAGWFSQGVSMVWVCSLHDISAVFRNVSQWFYCSCNIVSVSC